MSSATIIGLAALGNPQQTEGKALLFDAQFYLGPRTSMSAALRYFNNDNLDFPDVGTYVLCANVSILNLVKNFDILTSKQIAKIAEGAHLASVKLDVNDYDIVGDIQWVSGLSLIVVLKSLIETLHPYRSSPQNQTMHGIVLGCSSVVLQGILTHGIGLSMSLLDNTPPLSRRIVFLRFYPSMQCSRKTHLAIRIRRHPFLQTILMSHFKDSLTASSTLMPMVRRSPSNLSLTSKISRF